MQDGNNGVPASVVSVPEVPPEIWTEIVALVKRGREAEYEERIARIEKECNETVGAIERVTQMRIERAKAHCDRYTEQKHFLLLGPPGYVVMLPTLSWKETALVLLIGVAAALIATHLRAFFA